MNWRYEAGEHRVKHCWNRPEAGFVHEGNAEIGKCPNTLPKALAEQLLNDGVPYVQASSEHPAKIYNVYNGVVYEAVPTQPGKSYHGYPWKKMPGRNLIPRRILKELESRAQLAGCLGAFKDWMKRHGS